MDVQTSCICDSPFYLHSDSWALQTPLEETMKIHYFEDKISDSSFASAKSTIMVYRQKFQEFDTVTWLYVNFKHTQKAKP